MALVMQILTLRIQHLEIVNRYVVSDRVHIFFCNVLIFFRTFSRGPLSKQEVLNRQQLTNSPAV